MALTRSTVCPSCRGHKALAVAKVCRACWRKQPRQRRDFAERFWEKADRSGGPDACWPWLGFTHEGYGRFTPERGKSAKAHRVAYELVVGPIPEGLDIDHLCRNRACVNPAHMETVTRAENSRRGSAAHHWNRAKTHCPRGHEYTAANTYTWRKRRHCLACSREASRRYAQQRRVAA